MDAPQFGHSTNKLSLSSFIFCRESKGLVGSRVMVASEEHLVDPDTLHIGPVRRTRRFPALFHTHAQDPQGSGKSETKRD